MKTIFSKIESLIIEMNSSNSSTDKIEVLKKYKDDEDVKKILFYTYNSFLNFNITSSNLKKKFDFITETKITFFELLDKLNTRDISGHMAIRFMNYFISQNEEYKELIYKIVDRNLEIRIDVKTINKVFNNLIPVFEVALANKYDEKTAKKVDIKKDDWLFSRKLDGCRCITIVDNGIVKFYSREGKEFKTLEKLREEITTFCFNNNLSNIVFDGEICVIGEDGNEDFSGTMRQITRKDFTIQKPKYFIFDLLKKEDFLQGFSNEVLSIRQSHLHNLFNRYRDSEILVHLDQYLLKEQSEIDTFKKVAADSNWEGLMMRKNVPYEGKRSNNLLKIKSFSDAEYEVVGIETGDFRIINKETKLEETIQTLTNIKIIHKGYEVSIGSGFSLEERNRFFENPNELIGRKVTVKYFEETENKKGGISLRFPTIKCIHGFEREV